jgi:hypothetical protein
MLRRTLAASSFTTAFRFRFSKPTFRIITHARPTPRRYGCNAVPGIDSNHHWFHQWEAKGDYPIRFFIEPIVRETTHSPPPTHPLHSSSRSPLLFQVLTINYALSLGYKHVVLFGLSGGGWSTTIAAAIDPRISLSIPVAGSVPKFPTELYPNMVRVPAQKHDAQTVFLVLM